MLIVNVASECGLTPQYAGLQRLADRGLVVLGVPCNQFGGQEPGTAEEIWRVLPDQLQSHLSLTEKVDVNGPDRHPLYQQLTPTADADGEAGDVQWNFEKFVVAPDGSVAARLRPQVIPEAPELLDAIERVLPKEQVS